MPMGVQRARCRSRGSASCAGGIQGGTCHVESLPSAARVKFIDGHNYWRILDASTTNPEHGDDLPRKVKTWTPQQLKTAMRRYFQTFQLHAEDLCEMANNCIRFPKTGMVRDTSSPAQRVIAAGAASGVLCISG